MPAIEIIDYLIGFLLSMGMVVSTRFSSSLSIGFGLALPYVFYFSYYYCGIFGRINCFLERSRSIAGFLTWIEFDADYDLYIWFSSGLMPC